MNFIIYENAEPILQEYPPSVALKILLEKHQEFPEYAIESMAEAAEMHLTITDPQLLYCTYVQAVVQIRYELADREIYSM